MGILLNMITSPSSAACVQNTVFQVMSEGSLKGIGRPAFTLMDKNGTPESRKYSATREFIYQFLCLGIYFAIVYPVFKNKAYKIVRKMKNFKGTEPFKPENFKTFSQLAGAVENKAKPDFIKAKGLMEGISILGSALTLTAFAPQVVNRILHPIMGVVDKRINKKNTVKEQKSGDTFQKT